MPAPQAGLAAFERDLAPARQALAVAAEAVWYTGRQLTLEQAIAEVLALA